MYLCISWYATDKCCCCCCWYWHCWCLSAVVSKLSHTLYTIIITISSSLSTHLTLILDTSSSSVVTLFLKCINNNIWSIVFTCDLWLVYSASTYWIQFTSRACRGLKQIINDISTGSKLMNSVQYNHVWTNECWRNRLGLSKSFIFLSKANNTPVFPSNVAK